MASLTPYFGNNSGDLAIEVARFSVGTGSFKTFTDFHADFAGSYTVFFQKHSLTIGIKLTNENPEETSGACEITFNKDTDAAATYSVKGKKITFNTKLNDTPVDIYKSRGGTQIDNVSGLNIWIGPG